MLSLIPLKIKLIIGFLVIFIFILTVSLFIVSQSEPLLPIPTPLPTPNDLPYEQPGYTGPEPSSVYQTSTPESERLAEINQRNGRLVTKLPYQGNNFLLVYDYDRNSFVAVFQASTEAQGKVELTQFLKANGIESTDWLTNFTIEVK